MSCCERKKLTYPAASAEAAEFIFYVTEEQTGWEERFFLRQVKIRRFFSRINPLNLLLMVEQLLAQFSGARYGELVHEHFRKQNQANTLGAFQFIHSELSKKFAEIDISPLVNVWHEASTNKVLFRGDCAAVFKQINRSLDEFVGGEYSVTDDDYLNFFNLVTLNLAYNAQIDSGYRSHFFNSFRDKGFFAKIFLNQKEKVFMELWEKDCSVSEDFDSLEYCKVFTKGYFVWLYKDFGVGVSAIKSYCYKKYHLLAIATHFRGQNLYSTRRVFGNFFEVLYRPNPSIGLTSSAPYVLDCQSLSMANKIVSDFISSRHGVEGVDWDIVGSGYLSDGAIKYGTVRKVFGSHRTGQFQYYFDFSIPNSNPLNKI